MNLPRIIAERCVLSLLETASCQACVNACPRDAWILDDDALGLDLEACDGCGLCRPVCPEGAIDINLPIAIKTCQDQQVGMAACDRSGVEEVKGILPCIHALGLQEILRLYQRGARQLVVAMGECDECPRGGNRRLDQRIASLNRLLQHSGHPSFMLEQQTGSEWTAYQLQMGEMPAGPLVSRRGFLRAFVDADERVASSLSLFLGGEGELFDPPAQLLPDLVADSILPYVPEIDPHRCTGCDACVRICPHNALFVDTDESGPGYRLEASRCTDCGLCVDVCDQEAILVRHWTVQLHQSVPLREAICSACGAPFHEPETADKVNNALCRICLHTNHHRNLYQIL